MKKFFLMVIVVMVMFLTLSAWAQDTYTDARRAAYQLELQSAVTNFDRAALALYQVNEKWGLYQDGADFDMAQDLTAANQTECEANDGAIWVAESNLCKGRITVGIYAGMNELYIQNGIGAIQNFMDTWWSVQKVNFQRLLK